MVFSFLIRGAFWFGIWALTLFGADIEVTYADGAHYKFTGWYTRYFGKKDKEE